MDTHLLMARAGAIDNFGSAANAPRDKIEDLRDEPDFDKICGTVERIASAAFGAVAVVR